MIKYLLQNLKATVEVLIKLLRLLDFKIKRIMRAAQPPPLLKLITKLKIKQLGLFRIKINPV